jgi:glycosyltransferase involved in cell wall biosynthesis
MARIEEWALAPQVKMVGEVVGNAKQGLFEHADVVVVPSHTENFGMVIAEALAHGVPVITSTGTPWKSVEDVDCGFWVGNDPETLAGAIVRMSRMPLREMGQRGREWMRKEFAWPAVAEKMMQAYHRLLGHLP